MSIFSWIKYKIPHSVIRPISIIYRTPSKLYTHVYIRKCKISPHKVVLNSYEGGAYGDSPKYIAEEFLRRGGDWDLVWLAKDTNIALPKGIRCVRYGTAKALREIASAKYYVDNARGSLRPPKRPGQVYLQTWHGFGFKAVEGAATDKLSEAYIAGSKRDGYDSDAIISCCAIQSEEYRKYFWLNEKTQILEIGFPRNDILYDQQAVQRVSQKVRQQLEIDTESKIVLYMPTFRNNNKVDAYGVDHHGVISALEKNFGGTFAVAIRMHPNVKHLGDLIKYDDKIKNATNYPDAQELYMAADLLITDYSSVAFDFSLLRRPVILCAFDYDGYEDERGLTEVYHICPFPKCSSNAELIACIQQFSLEKYHEDLCAFEKTWRPFGQGDAASKAVDWMLEQKS